MPEIGFDTVPFIIRVGDVDFVDGDNLDTDEMLTAMELEPEASSTACPSSGAFEELFERADKVICITASARLSGSYNSADMALRAVQERHPEKQLALINSFATGPDTALSIDLMLRLIREGRPFDEVVEEAKAFLDETRTVFALKSFRNLVKSGRMPKLVGFLAGALGVWGIGIGSDRGEIIIKGKARGAAKAVKIIVEDMFQRGYNGGRVLISHAHNPEFAQRVADSIKAHWSNAHVLIIPARGLDSFYAERGGIIVGY
ncbi:MAG: DegV family protein [Eggerthellaceae bacterium]|nr:DegV family protein [Eggerthellaceae bacterium]